MKRHFEFLIKFNFVDPDLPQELHLLVCIFINRNSDFILELMSSQIFFSQEQNALIGLVWRTDLTWVVSDDEFKASKKSSTEILMKK
jgi:hypothetical protein